MTTPTTHHGIIPLIETNKNHLLFKFSSKYPRISADKLFNKQIFESILPTSIDNHTLEYPVEFIFWVFVNGMESIHHNNPLTPTLSVVL